MPTELRTVSAQDVLAVLSPAVVHACEDPHEVLALVTHGVFRAHGFVERDMHSATSGVAGAGGDWPNALAPRAFAAHGTACLFCCAPFSPDVLVLHVQAQDAACVPAQRLVQQAPLQALGQAGPPTQAGNNPEAAAAGFAASMAAHVTAPVATHTLGLCVGSFLLPDDVAPPHSAVLQPMGR